MSLFDEAKKFVANATPEKREALDLAVKVAEAALAKVDDLSEEYGIPVEVAYAGWFIPGSFELMSEDYDGYSIYSTESLAEQLYEDEDEDDDGNTVDLDYAEVDALVTKIEEILGTNYISYKDAWDTSYC